jgi:hypothetical protein
MDIRPYGVRLSYMIPFDGLLISIQQYRRGRGPLREFVFFGGLRLAEVTLSISEAGGKP